MGRTTPIAWTLGLLVLSGCDGAEEPDDAGGRTDAGPRTLIDAASGRGDGGPFDAGPFDAGGTDAGASDAGPPTMGVFVASGAVGRTIASFDDGHTWTDDASDRGGVICTSGTNADPAHYCWEGDLTGRGIAFVDGDFFTTYAWARESGRSNSVRRSSDGRTWTDVVMPAGYGGIAAGAGRVVLAGPSGTTYMRWSDDRGATWNDVDNGFGGWTNFRHAEFVTAFGGRFVFFADGNAATNESVVLSADGETWTPPSDYPRRVSHSDAPPGWNRSDRRSHRARRDDRRDMLQRRRRRHVVGRGLARQCVEPRRLVARRSHRGVVARTATRDDRRRDVDDAADHPGQREHRRGRP
ncbi:MAG: hypothetical protein AB7S26_03680 [Sandaracinaceae bacterium]